jgi:metal-dependent HD superfamily phosphatase/phosphodiesterase
MLKYTSKIMNKTTKTETPVNKIHIPTNGNSILEQAINNINENQEINTLWRVINVNAVDRLGMSDHGPVHFQIVANISVKFVRMLVDAGVEMSVTKNYKLSSEYAELIVFLASVLHDLGMTISRKEHETYSLFLANNLLHQVIDFLPVVERTIVASEVLHAIISHRSDGKPLTLEAGIVRVADALDMSEGRSRIVYKLEKLDIYSVSAAAIDKVNINKGTEKPIQIDILMNNSAGIFQLDELLKKKIIGSGIEKYVDVHAYIKQQTEKGLIKEYRL